MLARWHQSECLLLQLAELEALNAELEDANTQLEAVALAAGAQRDAARTDAAQATVRDLPPLVPFFPCQQACFQLT